VAFRHLEIIELKQYAGAHSRVFAVGCDEEVRGEFVDKHNRIDWSVPLNAQVGDLILMYRKSPASEIRDLWKIVGPFFEQKGWGLQAYLKLVVRLGKPLTFAELKSEPSTRNLGIVRKRFQGKTDITNDWQLLSQVILRRNPKVKPYLREYHVE